MYGAINGHNRYYSHSRYYGNNGYCVVNPYTQWQNPTNPPYPWPYIC